MQASRTLNAISRCADHLEVTHQHDLDPGDCVIVSTKNSVYRLLSLGDGVFHVSGGWFDRYPGPQAMTLNGCTFGGMAICPDVVAGPCMQWQEELKQEIPTIVIAVRDAGGADVADAAIYVDGVVYPSPPGVPIALDPGPHRIRAVRGEAERATEIVLRVGERRRVIDIAFPGTPAPEPTTPVAV